MAGRGAVKQLEVLIADEHAGMVRMDSGGRLDFAYARSWNSAHPAFPLSYALPQSLSRHDHRHVSAFLWGLLPENPMVLDRLARDNQISARNPLALLSVIGMDCPGAVRFLTVQDFPNHTRSQVPDDPEICWLSDKEVRDLLVDLRVSIGATGRRSGDPGQFSLAGAQAKTALFRNGSRWGIPLGTTPTTHILKPPVAGLDGQVENEHFCLCLARRLGLPAALSEVVTFDDEVAITVERFDRIRVNGEIQRIHQEDMCQALSVMPDAKYQKDGGPGAASIVGKVLSASSEPDHDSRCFMQACLLNFVIAGTDAHGKNYSVLYDDDAMRLAPLYDVNSMLPYQPDSRRIRMSMSTGGRYELFGIMPRHWIAQAKACGVSPGRTLADLDRLIDLIPDAAHAVAEQCHRDGLIHPVITTLREALVERCRYLATCFGSSRLGRQA